MNELPFDEPEFVNKWNEWLAYRAEKKLPKYKPIGLSKTLARLKKESEGNVTEAIDMLEYSMEQNWQGIFKRNKNGTHQRTFTTASPKLGTSAARIEALKKWGFSNSGE